MDEDARKRKVEYNMERRKELGYKKIGADFLPHEYKEINDYITQRGINKADLIRYGYKQLKLEDNIGIDKDILQKGKNVVQRYSSLMSLNDRNIIDKFLKEIDKI